MDRREEPQMKRTVPNTERVLKYIGAMDTPPQPEEYQAKRLYNRIHELTEAVEQTRKKLFKAYNVDDLMTQARRYAKTEKRKELKKQLASMESKGIPGFDIDEALELNHVSDYQALRMFIENRIEQGRVDVLPAWEHYRTTVEALNVYMSVAISTKLEEEKETKTDLQASTLQDVLVEIYANPERYGTPGYERIAERFTYDGGKTLNADSLRTIHSQDKAEIDARVQRKTRLSHTPALITPPTPSVPITPPQASETTNPAGKRSPLLCTGRRLL